MSQLSSPRKLLGLCGSLRARSYNLGALQAAAELLDAQLGSLQIASLRGIPIYEADEQKEGFPAEVLALGEAIRAADAVLIASPEYNFGIPGGLKNALDWLSRLPDAPLRGKPVAILGAATGPVGTARMQYELRKVLLFLDAEVLGKPEIFISHAASKFDASGRLVDAQTRAFMGTQLQALLALIARIQAGACQSPDVLLQRRVCPDIPSALKT